MLVHVNSVALEQLLNKVEQETGKRPQPDGNGVYKIYGCEVVLLDKWDENNTTC